MIVSYNWFISYLNKNPGLSMNEMADLLTNTGLEVEGHNPYVSVPGALKGLIVGHVVEITKHPDADRLKVTKVDVGTGDLLSIVCGAPNVDKGQKVVVAPVGATLYPLAGEPFHIKKTKIRGIESFGMICAEDEIGVGSSHDGIIVLPEQSIVGSAAKDCFNIVEDHLFEIGLTPNRTDAESHLGVARDIIAALNANSTESYHLKLPDVSEFKLDDNELNIEVEVEDLKACPRYSGLSLTNLTVGESPEWMKAKLNAIGVNPINNIVDITNFVLHELGQPLHAFDADKIKGNKVVVKSGFQKSPFVTLDEIERKLDPNDLMICDTKDPMCIAGVYGGIDSGVSSETKNIFLESAHFNPKSVRLTATRHGLKTDAAQRFEKGSDPEITIVALKRAAMLIKELAAASISSEIIDVYPQKIIPSKAVLRFERLNRIAGDSIEIIKVKNILKDLDFVILTEDNLQLELEVPLYRADVKREIDIIEEVLRIYDFNNIPMPQNVKLSLSPGKKVSNDKLVNKVANYLSSQGYLEMINNPLSQSSYYPETEQGRLLGILKSVNSELNILRPDMLYSGLETIRRNKNHSNHDLSFYEFGKIYFNSETVDYSEEARLSVFSSGKVIAESWKKEERDADFYSLKARLENLLLLLGFDGLKYQDSSSQYLDYGLAVNYKNECLGTIGLVKKSILKSMDIADPVYFIDLSWDKIVRSYKKGAVRVKPISKFPGSRRDLALLVESQVKFDEIAEIATKTGKKILKDVNLFDVYVDSEKLGKNKKSYAVSFYFQDELKTLTDKEIEKVMSKLQYRYTQELGAEIR